MLVQAKVLRAEVAYRPRRQLVVHCEGLALRFFNFWGSQQKQFQREAEKGAGEKGEKGERPARAERQERPERTEKKPREAAGDEAGGGKKKSDKPGGEGAGPKNKK